MTAILCANLRHVLRLWLMVLYVSANACLPPSVSHLLGADQQSTDVLPVSKSFRLLDGVEIPIEEWGETYEAYECASMQLESKSQILIDLGEGSAMKISAIAPDPARKRLFWVGYRAGPKSCHIGVVNYNGAGMRIVIDKISYAGHLKIDFKVGKLYWTEQAVDRSYVIRRADLEGKSQEVVIDGLLEPRDLAIGRNGSVFFADGARIFRVDAARGREIEIYRSTRGTPFRLAYDTTKNRIYWASDVAGNALFFSADESGSDIRSVSIAAAGGAYSLQFNAADQKLYWGDNYGACRSDASGRQFERVAWSGSANYVDAAIDAENLRLFWTSHNHWRLVTSAIPPAPKKVVKSAPPIILEIVPKVPVAAGESLVLKGRGFTGTSNVVCVADERGTHVPCEFIVMSDDKLQLTVPKLPQGSRRFSVIIRSANGVTVTMSSGTTAIKKTVSLKRGDNQSDSFLVQSGGWLAGIEQCICVVEAGGKADPQVRGAVEFVKNGGLLRVGGKQGNTIYREPFAHVVVDPQEEDCISVPGIRLSFVSELPEYHVGVAR